MRTPILALALCLLSGCDPIARLVLQDGGHEAKVALAPGVAVTATAVTMGNIHYGISLYIQTADSVTVYPNRIVVTVAGEPVPYSVSFNQHPRRFVDADEEVEQSSPDFPLSLAPEEAVLGYGFNLGNLDEAGVQISIQADNFVYVSGEPFNLRPIVFNNVKA